MSKLPSCPGYHTTADIKVPEPRDLEARKAVSKCGTWKKAAEAEYQSLMKHDTWDLVPLPHGKKLVSGRWVLRVKHDENAQAEWYWL